jgi:hypothetical protein
MNAPHSLPVDLADRQDILAKLPEAEKILNLMERGVEDQQRELDRWRDLVGILRSIAGKPQGSAQGSRGPATATVPSAAPMQDLVVEVMDREVRPLRAKEVSEILRGEGHELTSDSVSNALWQASKGNKRIRKLRGRGVYAPLAYTESETTNAPVPVGSDANDREASYAPAYPPYPGYEPGGGPRAGGP